MRSIMRMGPIDHVDADDTNHDGENRLDHKDKGVDWINHYGEGVDGGDYGS